MQKRIPYSLWKQYYRQFPADQYDQQSKTILVDFPAVKRGKFPKEWERCGNRYFTPGGCEVLFWNSGLARNYLVQRSVTAFYQLTRTIAPSLDSMQRVVDTVREFEGGELMAGSSRYLYGMKYRGFAPGCQPMEGFVERRDDEKGRYFDVLVYDRVLSNEEVNCYELEFIMCKMGG